MTFHTTWILLAVVGVVYLAVAAVRFWATPPVTRRRSMSGLGFIAVIGVGLLFLSLQHLLGDSPRLLEHPVSSGLAFLNVLVVAYALYLLVVSLLAIFRGRAPKPPA